MKKVLFSIASAALLLASCAKERLEAPQQDVVTFEVALENAASTRANIGDGNTCDELIYEVYDAGMNRLGLSGTTSITAGKATVSINLAKGQTYSFAFWAQKKGTGYYTTDDLRTVKVNYEGAVANDETRDAFFAYVKPSVSNVAKRSVVLKRPFAQLNLAVTDLAAAKAAGITLAEVSVVTETGSALDVVTGAVTESATVPFAAVSAQSITEKLKPQGHTGEGYDWISMNYILPADESENGNSRTLGDVVFTLTTNHDEIVLSSSNTPIQRNWRTNIIAKLTEENVFEVEIDPTIYDINVNLDGDEDDQPTVEEYGVSMGGQLYRTINDALAEAAEDAVIEVAAGEYDLTQGGLSVKAETGASNLVIANGVTVQAAEGLSAEDVVLNGSVNIKKGALKNVTLSGVSVPDNGNLMSSAAHGDCLVEGVVFNCPAAGTVNAFKEYSGASDGESYNLTFRNCTFNTNGQRALQFDIMNVTVEGCTFDNPYRYVVQLGEYAKGCNLTFKNNTVKNYGSTNKDFYTYVQVCDTGADKNNVVVLEGNTQSTTVEGAASKWVDYYIENTASNVKITVDGCKALADGVLYDPETKVAEITKGGEKQIDLAVVAGAAEIRLAEGEYSLSKVGPSADLKITGASAGARVSLKGGDLRWNTITLENMTIISPATGDNPNGGVISVGGTTVHNNCVIENVYFCLSPKTEFNGCTFNMTNSNTYNVWTYGSNVDFNGCVFNSAGKSALVYAHGDGGDRTYRKTNFKGCRFYASTPVTGKAAIEIDSSLCPFEVNVENCTAEGFAAGSVSGDTLHNLKKGEYGVNCNLTVKLADGAQFHNGNYEISNANGLVWASANAFIANGAKAVDIMNDIDMSGVAYTPAHYTTNTGALTLNGNGHAISNLTVNGGVYAALLGRVSSTIVIKDLTIKDSYFAADNNKDGEYAVGAFIGWMASHADGTYTQLVNCKAENVTYGSSKYVGGLVGYQTAKAIEITGCSVTGMNLTSEYTEDGGANYKGHAGGAIGYFTEGKISGTSVEGTMTVKGPRCGGLVGSAQAGAVIGTENTIKVTLNGETAAVVGSVDNRTNKDNSGVTVL